MARDQQYSRELALDVRGFLQLYIGALSIEDDQQRVRTVTVILLAGRLGLRASEIQHLHEGWIDWELGIIRVPAHDPCACKWCCDAARQKIAHKRGVQQSEVDLDDPEVLDYLYENQYEPKPNTSARVIPFGWSKRITACLLHFFGTNEYVDVTQQQLRDDVRKAGSYAMGVDPSNLTPHPLRATGLTFMADLGLDEKPHRDVSGHSGRAESRRYVRGSGRHLIRLIYRLAGREEWAPQIVPEDPGEEFPIACDSRPFAGETDFDPRDGGPEERNERAEELADEDERLYNPRRERRPDELDYDPSAHSIPGHVDPEGPGLEGPDVERVESNRDLREWISHKNEQAEDVDEVDRRTGLSDFEDDEEGAMAPTVGVKAAYAVVLVAVSWSLTLAPVL